MTKLAKPTKTHNAEDIIRAAGILLESAHGPVSTFLELVLNEPIKGNWWSHPKGGYLYQMTRSARDNPNVLVCRLVLGKVTYVHKRLWPALVRASHKLPKDRLARIREEHTPSGAHKTIATPFPEWVPASVTKQAAALDETKAIAKLGPALALEGAKPRRRSPKG